MFGVMHVVHVSARADESIGQDSTNRVTMVTYTEAVMFV